LRWLTDENIAGGRTRLLLWLVRRTAEGQREFKVTNKDVEEIGLSPRRKNECLHELENLGYIKVARHGKQAALVSVLPGLWVGQPEGE
jgi:hypothetical protein